MRFFFDESGTFQLPRAGEHAVGIVSGIAIADADEAEIFRRFDAFLSKLPSSSFKNGEPKGKFLDDSSRKALATMLAALPGILLRPVMLDLTSLAGQPHAQVASLVSRKLTELEAACRHETMRNQLAGLALDVGTVISAKTILCEEDNLQHVIWQLVMATNKVVLLYTIYATCAVSLIESRAYIAKELLLTATQLP